MKNFNDEVSKRITSNSKNKKLIRSANKFIKDSFLPKYSYNFSYLGRPIIQYPQDIIALQEIIWKNKPDLIIETGIAHGGSLILSASMLTTLDVCDAIKKNKIYDPKQSKRKVLGIDIDIRPHNKKLIEKHPMFNKIQMIEGSSVDIKVVEKVKKIAKKYKNILVCLDSNHTHDHVLSELKCYTPLVTKGSYCIVFDTILNNFPNKFFKDRPWNKKIILRPPLMFF